MSLPDFCYLKPEASENEEEPGALFRGDRWGKGKEEKRPGLFNCVGLASHQPTEPNDTALVTLCKGHGTENLETFYRYLQKRSEEHTSELQSRQYLVCRLLLEKKKEDINLNKLLNYMHKT